ncbi:MAG: alkaline phosphatase family protein, partial [Acidobacteriaceae bacterium]
TRLPPRPVLFRSYTREQLADGPYPPTPWGELLAHSYSPNGGWYVMIIPADFQMETLGNIQTTHFSPYSYDRHVPLGFFGAPFAPGIYHGRVQPVDLAATFAALLGVNQPSASVGHILTQAFKPASDVTYPKPPPPPRTRHAATTTHHPPATTAPPPTPKATHQ